uniref:Haemolysin n=1 Tax=Brachyspira hyodysenteriae TaxID=159 RepID=Q9K5F6_BRAHO|nr:haemolysin [Brachyspira hyodysenteriae]
MSIKTIKYFSTIIVAVVAVLAGWWLWNYYMQSPWTRDGKIRAEQVSITPQVSGRIVELIYKRQPVWLSAGDSSVSAIDKTPFQTRRAERHRSTVWRKRISDSAQKPITKRIVVVISHKILFLPKNSIPLTSMLKRCRPVLMPHRRR